MTSFPPKPRSEHELFIQEVAIRLRFEYAEKGDPHWSAYDWLAIATNLQKTFGITATDLAEVQAFLQRFSPSRTRI